MLGLPDGITVCLFDLDGVLTKTAVVHERAWKRTFDQFLGDRGTFEESDYNDYVDGKPREDGIRDFLRSRGIDAPDDLVHTLSERKNDLVLELIREEGVEAYPGSVDYLARAAEAGLRRIVVSSSHNAADVLEAAGIAHYIEDRVDGHVIDALGLHGKPAPDSFLEGAKRAGTPPGGCVVFEDAIAGVEAGRAGNFGHVIGLDRVHHRQALLEHGADVVVNDLGELL
jgi:beta-phosphoglucomutase family hydrolase